MHMRMMMSRLSALPSIHVPCTTSSTNRIEEGDESLDDDTLDTHVTSFEQDSILARLDADKEQHDREMEEEEEDVPEIVQVVQPAMKRRASLVLPAKENVADVKKRVNGKSVGQVTRCCTSATAVAVC